MAEDKDKFVDVVTKLIELTQKNKIKWQSRDSSEVTKKYPNYRIEGLFTTNYKGKLLQLFQYRYKKPQDPFSVAFAAFSKEEWVTSVKLEIIDDYGNGLWQFPSINALSDLFSSVQYQLAGVKELIDNLLDEK